MTQKLKGKSSSYLFLPMSPDQFFEINNFIKSKEEALSPLDVNFDDIDEKDELQNYKIFDKLYRINSNVYIFSTRTITDSNRSNDQDI